jgi:hypothetical protein
VDSIGAGACCVPRERTTFRAADISFVYWQRAAPQVACATWTLAYVAAAIATSAVAIAVAHDSVAAALIIWACTAASLPLLSALRLLSFAAVASLCSRGVAVAVGSPGAAASSRPLAGGCLARAGRAAAFSAAVPIVITSPGGEDRERAAALFVSHALRAVKAARACDGAPLPPLAELSLSAAGMPAPPPLPAVAPAAAWIPPTV